jgi:hypothetical protein
MLARGMLASVPVAAESVTELAGIVRAADAYLLAHWLQRALADQVRLLALTIDERAIILPQLEDLPNGLAELGAVLAAEFE